MNNLERCLAFYKKYGVPMIREQFAGYEERIAVGLVGEGSDCFGFDDFISTDHDYGQGFCMWLTDEDYDSIGAALQERYEKLFDLAATDGLLQEGIMGQETPSQRMFIDKRRGVFRTGDFYKQLLGVDAAWLEEKAAESQWLSIPEDRLATAVNGQVFRDDAGYFTAIRSQLLCYYPDWVWRQRLGVELYHFSQNAQSNYARMMARRDYVTANICVQQAVKSVMAIAYLLNRKYAPYYKWMRRGLYGLEVLPELGQILDAMARVGCQAEAWEGVSYSPYALNMADPVVKAFEIMAGMILAEMNRQKIVEGEDSFLDIYSKRLLAEGTD